MPGVGFQWSVVDAKGVATAVTSDGTFEALAPGEFRVTAMAARGKGGTVTVTVPEQAVSTAPGKRFPTQASTELCAAAAPLALPQATAPNAGGGSGFDPTKTAAALDPTARRYVQPNDALNTAPVALLQQRRGASQNAATQAQTVGSSNFTFSAPVLSIPGRGLGLSLALTYNSRMWTISGSAINGYVADFNLDNDWPAPGFNIGFGKLVPTGAGAVMYIDGNGGRHPYAVTTYGVNGGAAFVGHTTDGALIDYTATLGPTGALTSGRLQLPDGTAVDFNAVGVNGIYATRVTDRNGNYITITYNGTYGGPAIDRVSDTLGRVYQFNYDTNGLLVGVTGPGLAGEASSHASAGPKVPGQVSVSGQFSSRSNRPAVTKRRTAVQTLTLLLLATVANASPEAVVTRAASARLEVRVANPQLQCGEPLKVAIEVRNEANTEIRLVIRARENFQKRGDGRVWVPCEGLGLSGSIDFSVGLKPGASWGDASEWFDLTQVCVLTPGNWSIRAVFDVTDEKGRVAVLESIEQHVVVDVPSGSAPKKRSSCSGTRNCRTVLERGGDSRLAAHCLAEIAPYDVHNVITALTNHDFTVAEVADLRKQAANRVVQIKQALAEYPTFAFVPDLEASLAAQELLSAKEPSATQRTLSANGGKVLNGRLSRALSELERVSGGNSK